VNLAAQHRRSILECCRIDVALEVKAGQTRVPHFTTIQKAGRRLLPNAPAQALLDQTLRHARPRAEQTGSGGRTRRSSA
jgi:hypothetical protein